MGTMGWTMDMQLWLVFQGLLAKAENYPPTDGNCICILVNTALMRYTYCWMSSIVDIWCSTCMRQDLPKRILTAPLFRSRRASTFSTDIILFWLKQSKTCNLGWNVAEFCNLQSPCRHQKTWACLLSLFWTSGLLHHFPWVDYYRSVHPGDFDSVNHRANGVKSHQTII